MRRIEDAVPREDLIDEVAKLQRTVTVGTECRDGPCTAKHANTIREVRLVRLPPCPAGGAGIIRDAVSIRVSRSVVARSLRCSVPPAAAFCLSNAMLWISAARTGRSFWTLRVWIRYDSRLYLDIATHGYNFFSCTLLPHPVRHYRPGQWCGNAGWFPGYPNLIMLMNRLGLSARFAAVLIPACFWLATLTLLWIRYMDTTVSVRNLAALGFAAFFFGQVYYRAAFPISIETFLVLLSIDLLRGEHWVLAGVSMAAAAFSYSTGFLLIPAVAVWVMIVARRSWLERLARLAATGGIGLLGYGGVMLYQRIATGVWGTFFKVQAKYDYGSGIHDPWTKFRQTVAPLAHPPYHLRVVPALQTFVVAIFMVILCLVARVARERVGTTESLILLTVLAFWLFPLVVGGLAHLYRAEALLLPSVAVLRLAPTVVVVLFVGVGLLLAYPMSILFYRGVLV
jgi:hypothetical protein